MAFSLAWFCDVSRGEDSKCQRREAGEFAPHFATQASARAAAARYVSSRRALPE
ncbi:MAG: hypothetical protein WB868_20335 [Xanthobacteraceae bacterium]